MTVEAGFGLFALGMIVTVVFFYFLLKFMEITNKENMKEEEREKVTDTILAKTLKRPPTAISMAGRRQCLCECFNWPIAKPFSEQRCRS